MNIRLHIEKKKLGQHLLHIGCDKKIWGVAAGGDRLGYRHHFTVNNPESRP
jgi:hypothetical protein